VIQSISVAYHVIYIQVFGTLMKRRKHGMCGKPAPFLFNLFTHGYIMLKYAALKFAIVSVLMIIEKRLLCVEHTLMVLAQICCISIAIS